MIGPGESGRCGKELRRAVEREGYNCRLLLIDDGVGDRAAYRLERGVFTTYPLLHPFRRADCQVALESSDLQGQRGDRLSGLGVVLNTDLGVCQHADDRLASIGCGPEMRRNDGWHPERRGGGRRQRLADGGELLGVADDGAGTEDESGDCPTAASNAPARLG